MEGIGSVVECFFELAVDSEAFDCGGLSSEGDNRNTDETRHSNLLRLETGPLKVRIFDELGDLANPRSA